MTTYDFESTDEGFTGSGNYVLQYVWETWPDTNSVGFTKHKYTWEDIYNSVDIVDHINAYDRLKTIINIIGLYMPEFIRCRMLEQTEYTQINKVFNGEIQ